MLDSIRSCSTISPPVDTIQHTAHMLGCLLIYFQNMVDWFLLQRDLLQCQVASILEAYSWHIARVQVKALRAQVISLKISFGIHIYFHGFTKHWEVFQGEAINIKSKIWLRWGARAGIEYSFGLATWDLFRTILRPWLLLVQKLMTMC